MADREQPYDPYIPSAGGNASQGGQAQGGNVRTQALQAVCRSPHFRSIRSTSALAGGVVEARGDTSIAAEGWTGTTACACCHRRCDQPFGCTAAAAMRLCNC